MASKAKDGRGRDKTRKKGAPQPMTAHKEKISKTFDPIRYLGRQWTFEQYLAKVSGTKQRRTASYIAWRQRIFKAKRRANRHGHSAGRWKRDKAAILASRTAT